MSDITLMVHRTPIKYPEDVRLIIEELNSRGLDAMDSDVQTAWEKYSEEEYCAGWMCIYKSDVAYRVDELIDKKYLVPFDEPINTEIRDATF